MNQLLMKEENKIKKLIYEIRGKQVMLASDVAKLYNSETKIINQVVKRNINRFPEDFCFKLTLAEWLNLRSQNVTSSENNNYGGVRYLPYVLTEYGITMLAGLLKSNIAVKVNIYIIKAFVKMRHNIIFNKDLFPHKFMLLENKVDDNTKRINELFDRFNTKDIVEECVLFEGEFYDAYSLLFDILNSAKEEVIIIDNYAGKELLDILKKIDKKIIIVSKNIDEILKKKYEKQYDNITFINNDCFHDRFIILDRNYLYICDASFKDLGKKCFAINEFNDKEYINTILNVLQKEKELIFEMHPLE